MLTLLLGFIGIILLVCFGATFLIGGAIAASVLGFVIPVAIIGGIIKFIFLGNSKREVYKGFSFFFKKG